MNLTKQTSSPRKANYATTDSFEKEQKSSKPTSPSFVRSAVSQMFPLGSKIAEHRVQTQPPSPVESAGGAKIPTFAENAALAQKRAQEAFFAKRQAEYNAQIEKNKKETEVKIEQALSVIRSEVAKIEKLNLQTNEKLKVLQKMALTEKSKNAGVYDINFLDIFIQMLRTLSADVSDNNTWMEAMITRRAKRGSAFAARSKKKGTSYSQSEELKLTRSVQ